MSGISASLNSASGASVVITACKNASPGASLSNPTVFTVTLSSANLNDSFYNGSVDFSSGDFISVFISITGGNVTDLSVQLDLF